VTARRHLRGRNPACRWHGRRGGTAAWAWSHRARWRHVWAARAQG